MAASNSAESEHFTDDADLITCGICHTEIQQYKSLPCFHFYCIGCIREWSKTRIDGFVSCAICHEKTLLPPGGVDGLSNIFMNFFVTELKDSSCPRLPKGTCGTGPDTSMTPNHDTGSIHLWQFLKELLLQPESYSYCIRWLDREEGIFKLKDSEKVATLWGRRKDRPAMNSDKMSRSIRQYYKKGIMKKTEVSQVYQFMKPC